MKTFQELTKKEKENAISHRFQELTKLIGEGMLQFQDDDIQKRINDALQKAEDMKTPWFAHEYLADDKVLTDFIGGIAKKEVQEYLFATPSDPRVVCGVCF